MKINPQLKTIKHKFRFHKSYFKNQKKNFSQTFMLQLN